LNTLTDPSSHVEFLVDLLSRVPSDKAPDAHVVLLSTVAHTKLSFGDVEGCRADIDAAWEILDNLAAVETTVNATYYRVAADYHKVRRRRPPPAFLRVFLYDM